MPESGRREGSENLGRLDSLLAATLLAVAVTAGGGGSDYPLGTMASQLVGLVLLARLGRGSRWRLHWDAARPEICLTAAVIGVVLLQLIPLPPAIWRSLPGRDLVAAVSDFMGTGGKWRPFSLDPEATVYSAQSLIPAGAAFFAAVIAAPHERRRLAEIVIALALASGAAGMLQTAGAIGVFYDTEHAPYAVGFFSNRNHQADLLVAGLILSVGVLASSQLRRGVILTSSVLALAFAAAVVATASRTGFALLALAILGCLFFLLRPRVGLLTVRTAVYLLPLVAMAWVFQDHPFIERLLQRFENHDDLRFTIWSNSVEAAASYFPIGSGLGTFNLVYPRFEDIHDLTPGWTNAAHNDFLELLVEMGVLGAVLIAAFAMGFLTRLARLSTSEGHALEKAACLAALILILHSAVDYPLRTTGLLTLFGLLLGLMVPTLRHIETRTAGGLAFRLNSQQSARLRTESGGDL